MALTKKQSITYFLLGCIPVRTLLSFLPLYLSPQHLYYYSFLLFAISFGFLYLYITNGRSNAYEAGGKTWWADMRLIHGLLYLTGAIYAFQKQRTAWIPLLTDTLLGLSFFIHHRFLS